MLLRLVWILLLLRGEGLGQYGPPRGVVRLQIVPPEGKSHHKLTLIDLNQLIIDAIHVKI